MSNPWPAGHLWPRTAMNAAQYKIVNLLKTFFFLLCSSVFISVCVINGLYRQLFFLQCGPETPKVWAPLNPSAHPLRIPQGPHLNSSLYLPPQCQLSSPSAGAFSVGHKYTVLFLIKTEKQKSHLISHPPPVTAYFPILLASKTSQMHSLYSNLSLSP